MAFKNLLSSRIGLTVITLTGNASQKKYPKLNKDEIAKFESDYLILFKPIRSI